MKKQYTIHIDDGFEDELRGFTKKLAKTLAYKARDEMTDAARFAIKEFYQDYSPSSYKRHVKNFLHKSFFGYYKNAHGQVAHGGVELTYERLDDIYGWTPEGVFSLVYTGQHGNIGMISRIGNAPAIPIMAPSPIEVIEHRRDDIVADVQKFADDVLADFSFNCEYFSY